MKHGSEFLLHKKALIWRARVWTDAQTPSEIEHRPRPNQNIIWRTNLDLA